MTSDGGTGLLRHEPCQKPKEVLPPQQFTLMVDVDLSSIFSFDHSYGKSWLLKVQITTFISD